MSHHSVITFVLTIFLTMASLPLAAQTANQQAQPENVPELLVKANTAYAEKDYLAFSKALERLRILRPYNGGYMYQLVIAYALLDDKSKAYDLMVRMQQQGLGYDFDESPDTMNIRGTQVYDYVNDIMKMAANPLGETESAFTLPESVSLPETIAWDESRQKFLIGTATEGSTFTTKDRLRDVKYLLRQSREDIFPVVNNEGLLVGTLSKFQLDEDPPVRLILVDHNEMIQAVDGADEVPIVEIVDHHRVSIGPTTNPITITCDVVGSTCTLITEMYQRHDLTPPPDIAGVLLGGVVTDTLMLRSPTSTVRDRHAITYLEEISVVSGADLLRETLNVGSVIASMSPADALKADRKEYATSKCKFTVAQVEESSYDNFYAKRDDLLTELEASLEQLGIDLACLLVTDVIIEDSLLLVAGHKYLLNTIPYKPLDEHLFSLPRVLSRKKQLLPDLLKVFE